jgi:type VI secretion system protein ImpB
MTPGLKIKVDNTLADDGSQLSVELAFKSMEDFEPAAVVERVEPLRKLMDVRSQLRDLLSKADRSENLETLLEQILSDDTRLKALGEELGVAKEKTEG